MPSKTSSSCRLDGARLYSLHTQYDPWRASAFACRAGRDDNGLLGALQPVDLLFKLGDPPARALAASERLSASVRFRAVTGRPSRQLPRLGCANKQHAPATFIGRIERGFHFRFDHLFGALKQRRLLK